MLSNSFKGLVKHSSDGALLTMAQNGLHFLRQQMTSTHRQHLKLAVNYVEAELSRRVTESEELTQALQMQLNIDQQRICFE